MAKFFVKGTSAKVDLIKNNVEYANSIIFDTEKHIIYHNGAAYGVSSDFTDRIDSIEDALAAIKAFSTVSGNTGTAAAPSVNSTLSIKGALGITTSVGANGVSVEHTNKVTAGKISSQTAATLNFGGKFKVPAATYDTNGHITGNSEIELTLPAVPTQYTAKNVIGATDDAKANAVTTNETTFLNLVENNTVRSSNLIKGAGTVSVAADATGILTITGEAHKTLADLGGVPTSRKVTGTNGLTGGGALTGDLTISHATKPTTGTIATVTGGKFITSVNLDTYGHVASIGGANLSVEDIPNLTSAKITACTGYTAGSDAAIAASDSLNAALGKVQGLINALKDKSNGLVGAMHFKGVSDTLPEVDDYEAGDVVIVNGVEYVLTVNSSTKNWELFGDLSRVGQIESDVATLKTKPGLDKVGTVTSVAMTVPTGLKVTGSPITSSGTLAVTFDSGYSIPTTAKQTAWDAKVTFPGFGTEAPKANGTAAVGTATTAARADHVHPLQTSVSGNAGTATKLATARTISLGKDLSGSANFDGSADITINASLEWEEL